MEVNSQGTMQT